MNQIYNSKIKEKFLSQFNKNTARVYNVIFNKSYLLEEKLHKNLNEFNESEFEDFFMNYFKLKTKDSARTYCNVLSAYVQWSIDNNYSSKTINMIERRQDYYYKFIQKDKKYYLSKKELDFILSYLVNKQDQFLLLALFEGIEGKQLTNLTNLKLSDIDTTNKLVKMIDGKTRKVSDQLIELAKYANKQIEYEKRNGEAEEIPGTSTSSPLNQNDYILKTSLIKSNPNDNSPISHHTIHSRLKTIKWYDTEFNRGMYKDCITTKYLMRSGMIYEAFKIYSTKGGFTVDNAKAICKEYNVNYKWTLVEDFLNEDMIKQLYY